jgi:flagellar basal-body rod modification protein FlgD
MEVNGVNANRSSDQVASSSSNKSAGMIDYNGFLRLLIAQMRNQDPTNPTDSTEYMSQLAQLSTVEQAVQTNAKLDSLLSSSAIQQAEGLIGRTATFTDESGKDTSSKIKEVTIISGGAVATVENGVKVALGPGITIS